MASLHLPPPDFAAVIKGWKAKMSRGPMEMRHGRRLLAMSIDDDRTIWLDATGNPQELAASLIEAIELVRKWGKWREGGGSLPSKRPARRRGSA